MTHRRFWAKALPDEGGALALDAGTARHARVLRLRVGETIRLFDGAGREASARIERVSDGELLCHATASETVATAGGRIVIVQATPKGDKLDTIVRMSTELGVSAIQLATSERTVGRIEGSAVVKRLERLCRIAREAARQSGRAQIPDVLPPVPLLEAAARAPEAAARIVMWEESQQPLPTRIDAACAWIVIGPEGGVSEAEISRLTELGFGHRRMGQSVLRVDTAAAVAVALIIDRMSR